MRTLLITIAILCVAAPAAAQDTLIGAKVGGNFNQLSQPADPAGEPTLLFGTAFTGFGFQLGGTFYRKLTGLGFGPLFVNSDLLLSHQRATGFAESRTTPARRTLTIHTTGLRVPALIGVGFTGGSTMLNLAVGPELLLGLAAGSKTSAEGGADPGAPVEVRPVTHLGLTAHLGMIFEIGAQRFPIGARFTWDPFVENSTRDRFDDYVDFDNPGSYAVAFNWQAMLMAGVMFDLSGSKEPETPTGTPVPVEAEDPPQEDEPDEEPDLY